MLKRRYYYVFKWLRPLFRLYLQVFYAFQGVRYNDLDQAEPALILANHNGALDPFMLAVSFNRPIFFVASDHIFRLGWVSQLIRYLVNPIPIVKSQLDLQSLRQIRETIRAGALVGLFPEGNRSFTGITSYIPPSTGKLVKQLKCSLILYRFDGGYLATPRWSLYRRKGYFKGQVTRHLTAVELADLSAEQVYQLIKQELHVDAFADQQKYMSDYRGRRLAEALERVLFVCPNCRQLACLKSQADLFCCQNCSYSVRYQKNGFFQQVDEVTLKDNFLDSVAAWDNWQRQVLPSLLFAEGQLDLSGQKALFLDQEQTLILTERARRSQVLSQGTLALYSDRLLFIDSKDSSSYNFPLPVLSRLIVHGPQTLQFTSTDNKVYEVRSRKIRSAYKYLLVFALLQQQRKGEEYGFYGI